MSFDPAPRPALRRAADASAHPTAPTAPAPILGGATSDALRPAKPERTAKLKVQVPRSLKAGLQARAKAEGVTLDALVTRLLHER